MSSTTEMKESVVSNKAIVNISIEIPKSEFSFDDPLPIHETRLKKIVKSEKKEVTEK